MQCSLPAFITIPVEVQCSAVELKPLSGVTSATVTRFPCGTIGQTHIVREPHALRYHGGSRWRVDIRQAEVNVVPATSGTRDTRTCRAAASYLTNRLLK